MCYTVNSDSFLATLFALKEQNSFSFSKLNECKMKLEKSFDNKIYIDTTFDSLIESVEENEKIFSLREHKIILKKEGKIRLKNECYLNQNFKRWIPEGIREKYLRTLEQLIDEQKI